MSENTLTKYFLYLVSLGLIFAAGCGSSEATKEVSVEERFKDAMERYNDRDYLDAINEFKTISLQYPGSAYADDAQYYLGECHFKRGEFLLAAYEYGDMKRSFPASALVPDAQYKLGLSYYELSPPARLDQRYTTKAIDELQSFVEYYPSHEMAADAGAKIQELTDKLAEKAYNSAKLYQRMERYRAALHYLDEIIERYHDTNFAPLSYLTKTEIEITRKRYRSAKETVSRFISLFPNSVLRSQADRLLEEAESGLRSGDDRSSRVTSGASSGNSAFPQGLSPSTCR